MVFSPDDASIAAPGDKGVCLWHWPEDRRRVLPVAGFQVGGVAFSPEGQTLVAASPSGEVKFWHVASEEEVGTFRTNETVRNVAIFPDGRGLVTASTEGFLRFWQVADKDDAP
jgi:WD40 repeat protein